MMTTRIVFEPVDMAAAKTKKLMFYAIGQCQHLFEKKFLVPSFFNMFVRGNSYFSASRALCSLSQLPRYQYISRSEEKLCKVECVIKNKCEDEDAQCQKDCRTRCCKKSDKSKSSSSEFSEFCDTEGEVRCRQNCYDSEKCDRDDKECRAKCRENCCDEDNDLKGEDKQDSRNEPAPTPRPTSSSETLCNGITRKQRASVIFMRLSLITAVGDVYSDGEVDMGTPQGQAYKWILAEDDRVLCPLDTTLDQRYILAVLYYSTNGKEWTDNDKWLSESSECSWLGVSCNFRGEIDTIELRKLLTIILTAPKFVLVEQKTQFSFL